MTRPSIRPATADDREAWIALRAELWPGDGDHATEVAQQLDASDSHWPTEALLAFVGGVAVGFAEVSVRPCAEGCETRDVGYLEGWFVDARHRRSGIGRALVAAAESWARARGCTEFASDTEPENELSRRAHVECGFEDVGLVRCFRKDLRAGGADER